MKEEKPKRIELWGSRLSYKYHEGMYGTRTKYDSCDTKLTEIKEGEFIVNEEILRNVNLNYSAIEWIKKESEKL